MQMQRELTSFSVNQLLLISVQEKQSAKNIPLLQIMDAILLEKKKGERNFRNKIDQFLSKSLFTKQSQQLTPQTLTEIMQMPFFDGVCSNGKVNVDKLCEKITANDPKYTYKELYKVLGGKKEMKVTDLHQLLKNYQLTEFDLQEEMTSLLFNGNTLSISKLDEVMKSLGQPPLTPKDKQILIECFDYDGDGAVGLQDIERMLQICKEPGGFDLRSTQFGSQ